MSNELALSEDGYLLQKAFHSKCLKHEIDVSKIDLKTLITKEQVMKESDVVSWAGREPPKGSLAETHYIQELYKYNDPKSGDVVCWYDDIRVLSGSAGYMLIRDGYVWNSKAVWRS